MSNENTIKAYEAMQMIDTEVLLAVARGEIDLNNAAASEIASRGMDHDGKWVGFEEARQIHQDWAQEKGL